MLQCCACDQACDGAKQMGEAREWSPAKQDDNLVHLQFDAPTQTVWDASADGLRQQAADLRRRVSQLRKTNDEMRTGISSRRAGSKRMNEIVFEKQATIEVLSEEQKSALEHSPTKRETHHAPLEILQGDRGVDHQDEHSHDHPTGGDSSKMTPRRHSVKSVHSFLVADDDINVTVLEGSALTRGEITKWLMFLTAFGGVVFVVVAKATKLGEPDEGDDAHRRLGGAASTLMINISFCVFLAGVLAFYLNFIKQPMMLGYLLSGVLLGPQLIDIVHSYDDMSDVSSLGTIFLLFMIGLELDLSELFSMGKVVIVTGLAQFPICAGIGYGIFKALEYAGMSFGTGKYPQLYCALTTAISSTVLVVKLLCQQADMDSAPGRLTVNVLIFQDLWAIVMLTIQPNLVDPHVLDILKSIGLVAGLMVIGALYAKFVIPGVLLVASESVELMLIISLAWCFYMCCFATLPFIGLSAELAALISGVALATFPFSTEFNSKIKYIRDFFITLFMAGIGVQLPVPTWSQVAATLVVVLVVLIVRWIGIFFIVWLLGGGGRQAGIATLNLSQISEIALVMCSLGLRKPYEHIDHDTLTIITWAFAILFFMASYVIRCNAIIHTFLYRTFNRITGKQIYRGSAEEDEEAHADRHIVLLGFHKVAAMLVAHFDQHNSHLLQKIHVIDFNSEWMVELQRRNVTCTFGDISDPNVLSQGYRGDARLVICSVPDTLLSGTDNKHLLKIAKNTWPQAHVIVTADSPSQAQALYAGGADYVLRMAKLCAERLHILISEHCSHLVHRQHAGDEIAEKVFEDYKRKDQRRMSGFNLSALNLNASNDDSSQNANNDT